MRKHLLMDASNAENSDHLFNLVRNKIHGSLDEMEIMGPLLRLNSNEVRRIVTTAAAQALADRLYDDGFSDKDAVAFMTDRMEAARESDGEEQEGKDEEE